MNVLFLKHEFPLTENKMKVWKNKFVEIEN